MVSENLIRKHDAAFRENLVVGDVQLGEGHGVFDDVADMFHGLIREHVPIEIEDLQRLLFLEGVAQNAAVVVLHFVSD